ncbi:MAG TPA: peptidylprolyl isomerase [Thermomicrobiales bacterium]|nr:peptidylprolyl isomerase [Thermomicrobiales bacterium]
MNSSFGRLSVWARIRRSLGIGEPTTSAGRRLSRRDREQQNTRMLAATLAIVAVLTVISLAAGLAFENVVKPKAVLATVGDEEITRREYWQYHTVQLYQQANEYEEFAQQIDGPQRTQFLSYASSFRAQADDIWGTTEVSEPTLAQMVEDQLYLAAADESDIDLSESAVEAYALQQFAPEGAELTTPFPEPTLIPQRAEWATETAEAQATQVAEELEALGTPVAGTPVATPVAEADTTADDDVAIHEAATDFAQFRDRALDDANMSLDEYYEMVVRPELAREAVNAAVVAEVPQSAEQVRARHILVSTEDLARELYERAIGGADFAQLARANSIDTATAPTGGDLGWFTFDQMVEPFAEVAFALDPGSISEPVETQYGWHIIMVEDRDEDRALTELQYQQAQQRAVQDRLEELRASTEIEAEVDVIPTPSPTPETFFPPADAPTPIPATPVPGTPSADVNSVVATPVIEGPVFATPSDGSVD